MKLFQLLIEGTRDKVFQTYVDVLAAKEIETTASQLKDYMRRKLTTEAGINALSLRSSYYLSGATKYYFNGDLTTNSDLAVYHPDGSVTDSFDTVKCRKLNAIIIELRNRYIDSEGLEWSIVEDFGDLSIDALFRKFRKIVSTIDNETNGVSSPVQEPVEVPIKEPFNPNIGKKYTVDILYTHNMAEKYNNYTSPGSWCITQYGNDYYYKYYQRQNKTHFVIFRRNGWETEERKREKNKYPRDKYGTSLLAVQLKNDDGSFFCCTTRWNHGGFGDDPNIPDADFAVSWEQLQEITGCTYGDLERIQTEWNENKKNYTNTEKKEIEKNPEAFKRAVRQFKECNILLRSSQNPFVEVNGNKMFNSFIIPETNNNVEHYYDPEVDGKWNKVCMAVSLIDNESGNSYYALMDRGAVSIKSITESHHCPFDSLDIYDTYYSYNYDETKIEEIKKICDRFILFYPNRSKTSLSLYDKAKHSLVEINEKTKFKKLIGATKQNHLIIKIATNQFVFFDLITGKTLKADDGCDTFEAILQYASQVDSIYDVSRDKVLTIIGDRAAKKMYYYKNGKIIWFGTDSDGNPITPKLYWDDENMRFIPVNAYNELPIVSWGRGNFTDYIAPNDWEVKTKIYDTANKQYVNVGGKTVFKRFFTLFKNLICITLENNKECAFNVDTGKIFKTPNKIEFFDDISLNTEAYKNKKIFKFINFTIRKNRNSYSFLYNLDSNCWISFDGYSKDNADYIDYAYFPFDRSDVYCIEYLIGGNKISKFMNVLTGKFYKTNTGCDTFSSFVINYSQGSAFCSSTDGNEYSFEFDYSDKNFKKYFKTDSELTERMQRLINYKIN